MSGGNDGKVRGWDPKLSWKKAALEFDLSSLAHPGTEKMVSAVFAHGEMLMQETLIVCCPMLMVCACVRVTVS